MPYTKAQKGLFGLCSSPAGRSKARVKCPPMAESKKLAHEAAQFPEMRKAVKNRRDPRYH
jgi:hypothetical protein